MEVARTTEERRIGMSGRRKIGPREGMLFVFDEEQPLSFYMKDTYVPLSIAFIRADGVISNIEDMQSLSLDSHMSRVPCRYAFEMPQGWFNEFDIREGDKIAIPDKFDVAPDR